MTSHSFSFKMFSWRHKSEPSYIDKFLEEFKLNLFELLVELCFDGGMAFGLVIGDWYREVVWFVISMEAAEGIGNWCFCI